MLGFYVCLIIDFCDVNGGVCTVQMRMVVVAVMFWLESNLLNCYFWRFCGGHDILGSIWFRWCCASVWIKWIQRRRHQHSNNDMNSSVVSNTLVRKDNVWVFAKYTIPSIENAASVSARACQLGATAHTYQVTVRALQGPEMLSLFDWTRSVVWLLANR